MKLSDYLAQFLVDLGVNKVFLVTGGACANIVDSIGKNKDLSYVVMQHEQAAAMAADAYSRVTKNIGVAVATSGPGATNLITGVGCSYFDSIPTLMITGQVNTWETRDYVYENFPELIESARKHKPFRKLARNKIRQLGFQETNIVEIVKPITKFAIMIKDAKKIRYYLEKAIYLAKTGRPGPVWLDIPMDVQQADINPETLESFDASELEPPKGTRTTPAGSIVSTVARLRQSKRPVIIAGAGIKLGRAEIEFLELIARLRIPVVSTWGGIDILPYNHPIYVGQFGVYGNRAANFAVQNADLILSLGSRLDTRQTGGSPKTFAREAVKIVVDIDESELHKNWVVADIPINAHVKDFLTELNSVIATGTFICSDVTEWHLLCQKWKKQYPSVIPEYHNQKNSVNAYVFIKALSEKLSSNSIIIPDEGGNLTWTIQGWKLKDGHRLFSAFGNSPMGYALPASIGAAFADPSANIICIDGDGGFQMNVQDLQTVKHYKLPIKIFILNNRCYGIIKQFQELYFKARYEATDEEGGYTAPDFVKLAEAYGIATETISNHSEIDEKLTKVLEAKEPVLCNVVLDKGQKLMPKLVGVKLEDGTFISKPIEDLSPLLSREEFRNNMIVAPLKEAGDEKSSEIN